MFGQLVAHVQRRYGAPPAMLVTEFAVRPEHRTGLIGPLLAAALCDEADRLGTTEIVAIAHDRSAVDALRCMGFRHRVKLPVLLRRVPA